MTSDLPPYLTEQLMMDHLPVDSIVQAVAGAFNPMTCLISPGRAQMASRLMDVLADHPSAYTGEHRPIAWYVDLFAAAMTSRTLNSYSDSSREVEVVCSADLPNEVMQVVAVPILKRGEAEFARDILQQAHMRLSHGGLLLASVDNPQDTFVHDQLRAMFDKVTAVRLAEGCVYWGSKTNELRKAKDFSCQFAFKDEGQLIQVISRPSVFSHRRLDPGARQLMLAAEIGPEDHVLDMGCGSGVVALSCAMKTTGTVTGVDANARSVECLQRAAELNGLSNVRAELNADGNFELDQAIDVALANPPYFGDEVISRHFVDTCFSALRPGGALLVVTKQPSWYEDYFAGLLEDITTFESGRYFVACGRRPL